MKERLSSRFARWFLIFLLTFIGIAIYGTITDFQDWFFPSQYVRHIILAIVVLLTLAVQFVGEWLVLFDSFRKPPKQ
jgi:hypothetical protein